MKIAIMGSGGIGGYYGAMLQNGGADVTFIARGAQLEALRQSGIAVEGVKPVQLPKVQATDDPASIGPVDIVIFAVKLRDTETAARAILPVLKDGSAVHCRDARTPIAACDAEILVRRNLMIWSVSIYCTLVVRDTGMVSLG